MEKIHFYILGETRGETNSLQHLLSLFPLETHCIIFDNLAHLLLETSRTTGPIILILDIYALGLGYFHKELFEHLSNEIFIKYPVIFFISEESIKSISTIKENNFTYISRPISKLSLATTFENILHKYYPKIIFHQIQTYNNEKFTSIGIDILQNLNKSPCDIFLHLGNGNNEKFIKVINVNETRFGDIIEKYDHKGIHEFFILESDFQKIGDKLYSLQIYHSMEELDEKKDVVEKQELLHQKMAKLGLDKDLLFSTTTIISKVTQNIKNKSLRNLIHTHQTKKYPFIYDHSYLTSLFSILIAQHSQWSNEQIIEDLALAALVHDLALKDPNIALSEHIPSINSTSAPNNLTKEQFQQLYNHPYAMANILEKDPKIRSEVIKIVKNHHEGMQEASYPLKISASELTMPVCTFILAHEFTLGLYKIGFNLDKIDRLMSQLKNKFNYRPYLQLIESLTKAIHYD